MESVKEEVLRIIGDHLGIPGATLRLEAHLAYDLGADSLDRVELIMTIEERFRIKIPEEDIGGIDRITDIVAYVEKALQNK